MQLCSFTSYNESEVNKHKMISRNHVPTNNATHKNGEVLKQRSGMVHHYEGSQCMLSLVRISVNGTLSDSIAT